MAKLATSRHKRNTGKDYGMNSDSLFKIEYWESGAVTRLIAWVMAPNLEAALAKLNNHFIKREGPQPPRQIQSVNPAEGIYLQ